MNFSIDYLGFNVANVSFERDNESIVINTRSTRFAGYFTYSFDNTYRISIDSLFTPIIYQKHIEQKKYTENSITVYDFENMEAVFYDMHNDIQLLYDIRHDTRDFFSTLYYLRTLDLSQEHTMTVDAAGKLWTVNTRLRGYEQLSTHLGLRQTIRIEVSFEEFDDTPKIRSDIFTNNIVNPNNTLHIWFTNDDQKFPIKTQYNMKPFNIQWTLKSISLP